MFGMDEASESARAGPRIAERVGLNEDCGAVV
jgi:hypothetical protein